MRIEGFLEKIQAKDTRAGTMYDLVVRGDRYGYGKYEPRGIKEGDYVEFMSEQNGNFRNVARGTLKKADAPKQDATPPRNPAPSSAPPRTAPAASSWDDRQGVISKQAALNTAIDFVRLANEAGAISLGANAAKGYATLEAIVFEQARKFHLFSTGSDVEIPEAEVDLSVKGRKPSGKAKKPEADNPPDAEWDDDIPF